MHIREFNAVRNELWGTVRTVERTYMHRRRQVNGCRCRRRRRSRYLYFSTPNSNRMKLYCIEFASLLFFFKKFSAMVRDGDGREKEREKADEPTRYRSIYIC